MCGNGTQEAGEECDDGNDLNTDACTTACKSAFCGDGFTQDGVEQCDIPTGNHEVCLATCQWAPAVCGDGTRQFGETCDDGNLVDGDTCPSTCVINTCTPSGTRFNVAVSYAKPAAITVSGLVVRLRYPDGRVGIPGIGNAAGVRARITGLQTGYTHVANDLDYALRETLAPQTQGTSLNPASNVFRVSFDLCFNATPPVAGTFQCTVEGASNSSGQDINLTLNPITCSIRALIRVAGGPSRRSGPAPRGRA